MLAVLSVAAALIGIGYATVRYLRRPAPAEVGFTWRWVRNGYYLDNIYGSTLVLPGKLLAAWSAFIADQQVIDGAVNGVGWLVRRVGNALRPVQSGFVRNYGAAVMIGTVALVAWLLARGGF